MIQIVKSIKISGKYVKRCSNNTNIEFAPGINVLAGPNGSGKSTLIGALAQGYKQRPKEMDVRVAGAGQFVFLDTEKHNPRVKQQADNNIMLAVAMIFSSHGESVRPLVTRGLKEAIDTAIHKSDKPLVAIIDEPEAALDIDGVMLFIETLHKLIDKAQFVIASHSPFIWTADSINLIELVPGYVDRALERFIALKRK